MQRQVCQRPKLGHGNTPYQKLHLNSRRFARARSVVCWRAIGKTEPMADRLGRRYQRPKLLVGRMKPAFWARSARKWIAVVIGIQGQQHRAEQPHADKAWPTGMLSPYGLGRTSRPLQHGDDGHAGQGRPLD